MPEIYVYLLDASYAPLPFLCSPLSVPKFLPSVSSVLQPLVPETTKLTQELAVRLEQGETFVSGTQWQTEK